MGGRGKSLSQTAKAVSGEGREKRGNLYGYKGGRESTRWGGDLKYTTCTGEQGLRKPGGWHGP